MWALMMKAPDVTLPTVNPAYSAQSWFVFEIRFHCREKVPKRKGQTDKCVRVNNEMKLGFTCVLLRQHGSVKNSLKRSHPVFLVRLRLTCKQELALRGHDGDPELPVGALNVWGKARDGVVAVFFTPDKNLSARVRILDTQTHTIRTDQSGLFCRALLRHPPEDL